MVGPVGGDHQFHPELAGRRKETGRPAGLGAQQEQQTLHGENGANSAMESGREKGEKFPEPAPERIG